MPNKGQKLWQCSSQEEKRLAKSSLILTNRKWNSINRRVDTLTALAGQKITKVLRLKALRKRLQRQALYVEDDAEPESGTARSRKSRKATPSNKVFRLHAVELNRSAAARRAKNSQVKKKFAAALKRLSTPKINVNTKVPVSCTVSFISSDGTRRSQRLESMHYSDVERTNQHRQVFCIFRRTRHDMRKHGKSVNPFTAVQGRHCTLKA
jgi:hypothetical protein